MKKHKRVTVPRVGRTTSSKGTAAYLPNATGTPSKRKTCPMINSPGTCTVMLAPA